MGGSGVLRHSPCRAPTPPNGQLPELNFECKLVLSGKRGTGLPGGGLPAHLPAQARQFGRDGPRVLRGQGPGLVIPLLRALELALRLQDQGQAIGRIRALRVQFPGPGERQAGLVPFPQLAEGQTMMEVKNLVRLEASDRPGKILCRRLIFALLQAEESLLKKTQRLNVTAQVPAPSSHFGSHPAQGDRDHLIAGPGHQLFDLGPVKPPAVADPNPGDFSLVRIFVHGDLVELQDRGYLFGGQNLFHDELLHPSDLRHWEKEQSTCHFGTRTRSRKKPEKSQPDKGVNPSSISQPWTDLRQKQPQKNDKPSKA